MTSRRHYGCASLLGYIESGIAVVRVSGVVTPDSSAQVLSAAQGFAETNRPSGMIARYDDALIAIDAQRLHANALRTVGELGALRLPTALVVSRDTEEMWRDYAWLMAQAGIVRGVFTDVESASLWLRAKAAVWEQMRRSALWLLLVAMSLSESAPSLPVV